MKRFFLLTLLALAVCGGTFVVWMNSGGGAAVELTEAEKEAARQSGAATRAIEVDLGAEARRLPGLDDLKLVTDRELLAEWGEDTRRARDEADGEDRLLLTVLLAEIERLRGHVDEARALATEGAEGLPANSKARQINAATILAEIIRDAGDGGFGALIGNLSKVKTYKAELRAAVELDPTNCDARVAEIIVLAYPPFPVGNRKRARELVEELAPHDEFRRDFWRATLVALEEDRLEEALGMYRAMDERQPGDPDVVFALGGLLGKLGRWDEAKAEYDRLVAVEPLGRQGYTALYEGAKAREMLEVELDVALSMLQRLDRADPVGELMPGDDRIAYHEGRVLELLGRLGEARAAYRRSDEARPAQRRVVEALERVEAALAAEGGDGEG